MASVFLSYDREDVGRATPIARALEKAGHSVWWDRAIKGGAQYSKEIDKALAAADAVIVLWSERSADSAWVRDEAAAGRDSGRLVPVALDAASPPLGFRQFQTIDLAGWSGRGRVPRLTELLAAISELASAEEANEQPRSEPAPASRWRPNRLALALAAILVVAVAALAWKLIDRPVRAPLVAVVAADQSPTSQALARNLVVKLGSLRSARTDAVRLVAEEPGDRIDADLIFEAASNEDRSGPSGNLTLLPGEDRSILWSRDFKVEGGNRAAIEQSMAYTAGQVLDCALQANAWAGGKLDQQALKLFLNGCALFGDRYRSDPASVVPIFSQVVAIAPRFEPAWSKLLLAEAQTARGQIMFYDRPALGRLPEHIRTVRKLNPKVPELYIAEAALLPLSAFERRSRLADEAVRLNPDNVDVLISRSEFLHGIGRNADAVEDARRAVELNPLSPGLRSHFIQTLTYSGQFPAAKEELRRAQLLWPGTPTISDAHFRLHSRYGDAKEALRLVQSPDFRQPYPVRDMQAYLIARIDPTEANVQTALAAVRTAQLAETRKLVQLTQLLADFGRTDEIYDLLMDLPPDRLRLVSQALYRPNFRAFLHDPRFMQVARRARLLEFWRSSGKWPDICGEPGLPYDCKAEAEKLAGSRS